ncbi:MAG: FAD-dependent oxidoreductase, partial [Candidatus Bathyarchaeota archaeon]|nr:FAD-dependent oxidoreductase [Candidatus Bathyarchaeota archaeon]
MSQDWLKDIKSEYDVIVIGSGLAGLTCANMLARGGYSVLLLEQHSKLGG